MSRDISLRRLDADTFFVSSFSPTVWTSYKKECQETFLSVGSMPTFFLCRHSAHRFGRPIKRNVKRHFSPSARCRHFFCLGIQPNRLDVHSRSASGLAQAT